MHNRQALFIENKPFLCYIGRKMKNNILLIGKDFLENEAFVAYCKGKEIPFVCTTKAQAKSEGKETAFEGTKSIVPWNRASNLSSMNLIIRSETLLDSIDRVLLYFDYDHFTEEYSQLGKNHFQIIADELIASYQYITENILERFKEKKQGGFVFLLKEAVPLFRSSKNSIEINNPALYAAQEAFVAFAEMIAYRYSQKLENSVVLARTSLKNDEKIASLLFSLLESDKLEKKLQKDATRWLLLQDQNEGAIHFFK